MTTADPPAPSPVPTAPPAGPTPTRLLASALLHVLDRDEPLPARWRSDRFTTEVARHRVVLASLHTPADLDRLAGVTGVGSFRDAVTVLARDPFATALAIRRLELLRGATLHAWPLVVRHGVAPRITPAEQARWFG